MKIIAAIALPALAAGCANSTQILAQAVQAGDAPIHKEFLADVDAQAKAGTMSAADAALRHQEVSQLETIVSASTQP